MVSVALARSHCVCIARILALAVCAGIGVDSALAQEIPVTTFKAEPGVRDVPRDVAVTPNGGLAVVRSNPSGPFLDDEITIWRCSTGQRAIIGNKGPSFGKGRIDPGWASDALAVTNNWAVVVGAGSSATGDVEKTYIDVISLSGGPPACQGSYSLPASGQQFAGLVSDVEITPNEAWAVVHSRNWIHLIDLVNDATPIGINIGALDWPLEASPGPQSDSVCVTNAHAVVVTTRSHTTSGGGLRPHGWVYVIDLSTEPPSLVQLDPANNRFGYALQDPTNPESETPPHDVAISWSGSLAFVSASQMVALFWLTDPTGPSFVGQQFQPNFQRTYGLEAMPVDSVELTNDRALVLSCEDYISPPGPRTWALHVYDLWPEEYEGEPALDLLRVFKGSILGPFFEDDPPHDLALSEHDGIARGVVSTGETMILLPDMRDFAHPDGEIFFRQAATGPFSSPNVSVSDSTLIGSHVGTQQWALRIGSTGTSPSFARLQAWDILSSHPGSPSSQKKWSVSDPNHDVIPADIVRAHYGRDVVVRCYAPPDEAAPAVGNGRDLLRFYVHHSDPYEAARVGGKGHAILALDSMDVGLNSAASVSERVAPDGAGIWGYVHLLRVAFQ